MDNRKVLKKDLLEKVIKLEADNKQVRDAYSSMERKQKEQEGARRDVEQERDNLKAKLLHIKQSIETIAAIQFPDLSITSSGFDNYGCVEPQITNTEQTEVDKGELVLKHIHKLCG